MSVKKTWPCCIRCTLSLISIPVTQVLLVTPVFFFCLSRRRHWYSQCSRLPILCGPSQREADRRFVTTPINWEVCTHNWHPVSPLHKELWGSSSWVLEKSWPCCIGCTLSLISIPVMEVPLVMPVFFFCLPRRRHWYRQCCGLPILHG